MSELTSIAREAIAARLGTPGPGAPEPGTAREPHPGQPDLTEPGASFVTLTIGGRLRGCIGSLTARRPLGQDIAANARAAAFSDPRFPPLGAEELQSVAVEVSVLSPPVPLPVASRAEAERALAPGRDGVVLISGPHRATFLPQVWDQLPQPADFLSHLLAKAGLPPDSWPEGTRLETYTVTAYHE